VSVLSTKTMLRALGLAAFLLSLTAAPALAVTEWRVGLSSNPTTMPRSDERIVYEATVRNVGNTPTSGPVTVKIELPRGEETSIYKVRQPNSQATEESLPESSGSSPPLGWTCAKAAASGALRASVTCTRSDALAGGASYPTIAVVVHLGADAEAPVGTADATVSGGGVASDASDSAAYTFTPGLTFGILENSFSTTVSAGPAAVLPRGPGGSPPTTTIAAVGADTIELSAAAAASGEQLLAAGPQPFAVGQPISADGIPAGTTITAISEQSLILSAPTRKSARKVAISSGATTGTATLSLNNKLTEVVTATGTGTATAGSNLLTDVETDSGAFSAGQAIVATAINHTVAGGHPYSAGTTFGFNVHHIDNNEVVPIENIKDVVVDAPRGFVGNALSTPEFCQTVEEVTLGTCPQESAVGGVDIFTEPTDLFPFNLYPSQVPSRSGIFGGRSLFSIEPEFGQPAQFAFGILLGRVPYTFVPELRADEGYAVSFRTAPIVTKPELLGTNVTLCNFGANLGFTGLSSGYTFDSCREPTDSNAYPHPLITNPTRCSGPPPAAGLKIDSWQHPAEVKTTEAAQPAVTECENVEFTPEAELLPTNQEADSPTGLTVELKMPLEGVLSPTGVSQSNLDTVTVTLPEGMSINAATADGLEACSLAQIKMGSNAPDECPESSKVGTIEIDTPLIRETLTGAVYVAQQNNNPFKSTLGLYMSFASERDGVRIKVAGKLTPDPVTGQLVSTFTENPEAPFSRLAINFNQGPRSPLVNPPRCGTYAIHSEFSPWSAVNPANPTPDEIVSQDSTYEVTSGPNGSPCPNGALEPKLTAGVQNVQAGSKSPFVFTLSREDGTQRFSKIDVTTPKGLTAYLKGVPYCSDAVLAGIPAAEETGRPELANPACPPASQVGTSQAGAGVGPFPYYAPGRVYLAGPYKGAPVSLAVVTPAVAGPFDLGNVVVRNPLYVDPVTSQVKTESDPIPTILHGIILDVRDIRVALDRSGFTQAPTSCEPMAVDAHVSGLEGGNANVSNRFQVGGCENLGFKPSLSFRLFGGTHRGSHPKLRAILKARPGDANVAAASVALPHSEFLDQAHIRTVCTRVQFAAKACPPGSIYGEAEATTPLLDNPVKGPVYLRSSNNQLPDMVAALRGPEGQPIEVHLTGRIDSVNGGIRSTFDVVPDQPVSSFILTMQGGKKGLLVNSRNLCKGKTQRATAKFTGQNGKAITLRPKMQNACKGKAKKKNKKQKGADKRRNGR
jgi:hypothetical protein